MYSWVSPWLIVFQQGYTLGTCPVFWGQLSRQCESPTLLVGSRLWAKQRDQAKGFGELAGGFSLLQRVNQWWLYHAGLRGESSPFSGCKRFSQ
jgi:hypothetical protein